MTISKMVVQPGGSATKKEKILHINVKPGLKADTKITHRTASSNMKAATSDTPRRFLPGRSFAPRATSMTIGEVVPIITQSEIFKPSTVKRLKGYFGDATN